MSNYFSVDPRSASRRIPRVSASITMGYEVVLDIETKDSFHDVGEYNPSKLSLSLIGVYFSDTDSYESYLEEDLPRLWGRLEHADRIIGFNTKGFDYQVMNKYYAGDFFQFPSLDILEEVQKSIGRRIKLDDIAQATLGIGKSGHGLKAIEYWREGKIDELRKYCLDDVRITKELYEYGKTHGHLIYKDMRGQRCEFSIDFHVKPKTVAASINFSLPL